MTDAAPSTHRFDAELGDWIIDQSLSAGTLQSVLEGVGERLCRTGLPLRRIFIAMPMVSPELRAGVATWDRLEGYAGTGIRHDDGPDDFQHSPFKAMLDDDVMTRRWYPLEASGRTGFAILDRLAAEGVTDYLAHLVSYDQDVTRIMRGAAISFASDSPAGFAPDQIAGFARLAPLLGLSALRFATTFLVDEILGRYIGRRAGARILSGEIRRGEGHIMPAAIVFADLRGFTRLADRAGTGLVARLGHHLAAMAEPVEEQGGEVLKFLGDGLLATFAIEHGDPSTACRAALAAAHEALRRNAAVNASLPGEEPLDLDIALHRGEVFYGNIGAGSRLDFTVIGPAVNECSRIERLCDRFGLPLLMSADFARCCGAPVRSLGRQALPGVAEPREIFALA